MLEPKEKWIRTNGKGQFFFFFFKKGQRTKIRFNILCIIVIVGGQNLSLCVGLKVPLFNNNTSEEKKAWEKAP